MVKDKRQGYAVFTVMFVLWLGFSLSAMFLEAGGNPKLDTRAGMGPCQGRVCGAALSFLRGVPPDTVRPPLAPVPIAVLAEENAAATSPAAAGVRGPAPRSA